jgi:hypothetical protein
MRHSILIVAGLVGLGVFSSLATAASAAEYGAIAYDTGTGRWGDSRHYVTVGGATTKALAECAAAGCKTVIEIGPALCGALANTANYKGWGAASRSTRAAAELGAMEACQNANTGQCRLQVSDCNQ